MFKKPVQLLVSLESLPKAKASLIQDEYGDKQPLYQSGDNISGTRNIFKNYSNLNNLIHFWKINSFSAQHPSSDSESSQDMKITCNEFTRSDSVFSLLGDRAKISAWDAGWNVTNAIQEIF